MNEVELGTKSWHLNTIIKKLLLKRANAIYYMDSDVVTKMHAPNTDMTASNDSVFVFQSGKGVVSSHNLNLAQDND